jgi:hypothetical protein
MTHRGHEVDELARFPRWSRASSFILPLAFCLVSGLPGDVGPRASEAATITLRLTPSSISFPDASPDVTPLIGPATVMVSVKAEGSPGYPWVLTFLANSDLRSGPSVIPINKISFTSSPSPPFNSGTMSRVSPMLLGTGIAHINTALRMDFMLQNSWSYNVGAYSATATFTLSGP